MLESLSNLAVVIDDPGAGSFLQENWKLMAGAAICATLFVYFRNMTIGKILGAMGVALILIMIVPQLFSRA